MMINDSTSIYEAIRSNLDIWRQKIQSKKHFREEWSEFMTSSRNLIKKTMQIEENFFPKMTGDFGDSLDIAQSCQKSLDDFMPTVKVILFLLIQKI